MVKDIDFFSAKYTINISIYTVSVYYGIRAKLFNQLTSDLCFPISHMDLSTVCIMLYILHVLKQNYPHIHCNIQAGKLA